MIIKRQKIIANKHSNMPTRRNKKTIKENEIEQYNELNDGSPKKPKKPRNNRDAGNNFEVKIMNELKELGYEDAVTSRNASRVMDSKKVDVFGDSLPYHIQCKNSTMNFKVAEFFMEAEAVRPKDKPLVMIHKKTKKCRTNFVNQGEYFYSKKETFYDILLKLQELDAVKAELKELKNKLEQQEILLKK